MARRFVSHFASLLRPLAVAAALAGGCVLTVPAFAEQHGHGGNDGHWAHDGHDRHDHGHEFRRGPGIGLFLGAPAVVSPPPVYYAPAYPSPYGAYAYAPVPVTGVYLSPYGYGYCRDYRTVAGVETACQGADGVWRFIN